MMRYFDRDLFSIDGAVLFAGARFEDPRVVDVRLSGPDGYVRFSTPAAPTRTTGLRGWARGTDVVLVACRGADGAPDRPMVSVNGRAWQVREDLVAASPQAVAVWHDGDDFVLFCQVDSFRYARWRLGGGLPPAVFAIPDNPNGTTLGIRQVRPDGTLVWNHGPAGRAVDAGLTLPTYAAEFIVGQANDRTEAVSTVTGDRYVLAPFECEDHRAVKLGDRLVASGWAQGLREFYVDSDARPLERVAPPPPPVSPADASALPAWPRKLWASAFYSDSAKYGRTDDFLGNAVTLLEAGDGPMINALGRPVITSWVRASEANLNLTIAWWVTGANLDELGQRVRDALALPARPVIAYLDACGWPTARPDWVTDRVWPSVQCYRGEGRTAEAVNLESVEAYERRVGADVARVAAYGGPFGLTPQCYDRNGWVDETHALSTLSAIERWTREYEVILLHAFADRRPGGMRDLARVRAWWRAAVNAVPARPNRFDGWTAGDVASALRNKLAQDVSIVSLTRAERQFLRDRLG